MKQSHRATLPVVTSPVDFSDFLSGAAYDAALICHESDRSEGPLPIRISAGSRIAIAIGPEGGFTTEEVLGAESAGFVPWQLGPRRLRAETASFVALSAIVAACESSIQIQSDSLRRK